MKVVINRCYGGFSLSLTAIKEYLKRKGMNAYFYKLSDYQCGVAKYVRIDDAENNLFIHCSIKDLGETTNDIEDEFYFPDREIERNDPILISVIEDLGEKECSGACAELCVVEIPDDVKWEIDDYDGMETIEEVRRSWY